MAIFAGVGGAMVLTSVVMWFILPYDGKWFCKYVYVQCFYSYITFIVYVDLLTLLLND